MAEPKPSGQLIEVFFSYAHEDEKLRNELAKHLTLLERQEVIGSWHDREITAGTEWRGQIEQHLESAQVILLLISSSFLASDYCYDIELKRAMERHRAGSARVIPIILRAVDWQGTEFAELQALPASGKPVTSWDNLDEAFTDIAKGIRKAVEKPESKVRPSPTPIPEPAPRPPHPLDKHYRKVVNAIARNQIVPFLGADINLCDRPIGESGCPFTWNRNSTFPPSSSEMAAYLDEVSGSLYRHEIHCPFYDAKAGDLPEGCPVKNFLVSEDRRIEHLTLDLHQVSQVIDLELGSEDLYDALNSIISTDYSPNKVHKFFASLPSVLRKKNYPNPYQLIVTTNIDCSLEQAFKGACEPYDLVSYSANGEHHGRFIHRKPEGEIVVIDNPNSYQGLSLRERSVILKLYGPIEKTEIEGRFVITEDHYIDYLAHKGINELLPASLLRKLKRSHIWFLGYSLSYWNLRVILHRLWPNQDFGNRQWWSVQSSPQMFDKAMWERKFNAEFIHFPLEDYIDELNARLIEMPTSEVHHAP